MSLWLGYGSSHAAMRTVCRWVTSETVDANGGVVVEATMDCITFEDEGSGGPIEDDPGPDDPIPDPGPHNPPPPDQDEESCSVDLKDASISVSGFYMKAGEATVGRISNPTQGRWGNYFTYSATLEEAPPGVNVEVIQVYTYAPGKFTEENPVEGFQYGQSMFTQPVSRNGEFVIETTFKVTCPESTDEAEMKRVDRLPLYTASKEWVKKSEAPSVIFETITLAEYRDCLARTYALQQEITHTASSTIPVGAVLSLGLSTSVKLTTTETLTIPAGLKGQVQAVKRNTELEIRECGYSFTGFPECGPPYYFQKPSISLEYRNQQLCN